MYKAVKRLLAIPTFLLLFCVAPIIVNAYCADCDGCICCTNGAGYEPTIEGKSGCSTANGGHAGSCSTSCGGHKKKEGSEEKERNLNCPYQFGAGCYHTHFGCRFCSDKHFDGFDYHNHHTPGDWIRIQEPTCDVKGIEKLVCQGEHNCGQILAYRDVSALGHTESSTKVEHRDPTCTEKGWDIYGCVRLNQGGCTKTYQHDLAALGHSTNWNYHEQNGSVYLVTSMEALHETGSGNVGGGKRTEDCWRCGENFDKQWKYTAYVRFQNSDGSWPSGYTDLKSDYYNPGGTFSWSRAEDTDFQATSFSISTTDAPKTVYVDVVRRGYQVHYNNNGGSGTIPDALFVYNLTYNVSNDSTTFTRPGYRHLGWSWKKDSDSTVNAAKVPATVAEAVARFDNDLYNITSATNKHALNFNQQVKNLDGPGGSVTLYALWKPLWSLYLDYTIVSLPIEGNPTNPDNHTEPILGTVSVGPYQWYDYYDRISGKQSKLGDNHSLTTPSIKGWTFHGWTYEGLQVFNDTTWVWDKDITIRPNFTENRYKVRYNDRTPETTEVLGNYLGAWNEYEDSNPILPATVVGFEHPGWYLDGYNQTNDKRTSAVYKLPLPEWIEPGRTYTDTYKKLEETEGGTKDLYAVWKPTPVIVRIWDNYQLGTKTLNSENYLAVKANPWNISVASILPEAKCVEYVMYAVKPTTLPQQAELLAKFGITRANAKLLGFVVQDTHDANSRLDYVNTDLLPAQSWQVPADEIDLSSPTQPVVNLYCVWDDTPKIKSNTLPKLDYDTAIAQGIDVGSDGSVKMSELEDWCLRKANVLAEDYEYTKRYGEKYVPIGYHNGYSVKIASFDPVDVNDTLSETKNENGDDKHKNTANYLVTFIVIDDAGNQATCVSELYFGSEMSIMIDNN